MLTELAEDTRFERFDGRKDVISAVFCLVFPCLACLLLAVTAQYMTWYVFGWYQYMTWYVMEWCMSFTPTSCWAKCRDKDAVIQKNR